MRKKTVLVTGGAGFIGSHLCDFLLKENERVLCVDNLFTGSRWNIEHVMKNEHFDFVEQDIIDGYFPNEQIDQVYNLACPASPVHYQSNPIRTVKANTMGMINMLGLARKHNARILQASTSEVYGDPLEHPQKESYHGNVNTIGPRACYDDKTEILTEEGWILFKDLKQEQKVATLNESGCVEFHVPDEIIAQDFRGDLLHFKNTKYDICVTPNHKLYVRSKTGKLRFLQANENRHWPSWKAITGAIFSGEERESIEFIDVPTNAKIIIPSIRMDDWLEFLGYYISEGCTHIRTRNREVSGKTYSVSDYNILIAQEKPVGRRLITQCLTNTGLKFYDSDDHQFRICSKQLAEVLLPLGKSGDKFIPREYLKLSIRQSRILLNALIVGDGTVKSPHTFTYYTKSKQLADDVQILAMRCGFAANISQDSRNLYRVNIRAALDAKFVHPSVIKYNSTVYCVNVKNHIICVRRGGKAVWCGNCYDEGKRVAETLCFDYYREHGVDIRVARIFNTYGPRMAKNDGRVVSNFIMQGLQREPITMYGDGSQTRSFCYVTDMVEGLYKLMNGEVRGPVNLGNPDEFTIAELAEKVEKLTRSKRSRISLPLPENDPRKRRPDIGIARVRLGWMPKVMLDEGLAETVRYFQEECK